MGKDARANKAAGMSQAQVTAILSRENDYLFALLRNIELKAKLNEVMPREKVVEDKQADLVIVPG